MELLTTDEVDMTLGSRHTEVRLATRAMAAVAEVATDASVALLLLLTINGL